jgi:hypothetical protein
MELESAGINPTTRIFIRPLRLLQQGYARVHTASENWNESERTRRHRAAANAERERERAEIWRLLGNATALNMVAGKNLRVY